jgi:protein LSM14
MADLDSLIGSKISLISQQDIRYEGVLLSINAAESSIVLKDVAFLGTEDRVTDPSRIVKPSPVPLKFVSFPGADIKDLYVHEDTTPEPAPAPAPAAKPAAREQKPREQKPREERKPQQQPKQPQGPAGQGQSLMNLKVKGQSGTAPSTSDLKKSVFDFDAGLNAFDKTAELEKVKAENINTSATTASTVPEAPVYVKDDFFDSLSCDVLDRQAGRDTRVSHQQQNSLNMDTFGATGLQSNQRRYNRNRRGGGGGGRGRGGRSGRGSNTGN